MATEGQAQALRAGTGPKGPRLGPRARARAKDPCRRRRKAEQSWRLQPQDRVVSASFAPPCACACMDLGPGGPSPLWPCIGHVQTYFLVFAHLRTIFVHVHVQVDDVHVQVQVDGVAYK